MPRPVRNSVLKAKPLIAKKQAKNKHIARAVLGHMKEATEDASDILARCMQELADNLGWLDSYLAGVPGWDKECTAEQARCARKAIATLVRVNSWIDNSYVHAVACDDHLHDVME